MTIRHDFADAAAAAAFSRCRQPRCRYADTDILMFAE